MTKQKETSGVLAYWQITSCQLLSTVNKRLDEWVSVHRLDKTRMQLPKKEDQKRVTKGAGSGSGSRPCSPERELMNGTPGRPAKSAIGRKRKANAVDSKSQEIEVCVGCSMYFLFGWSILFSPLPGNSWALGVLRLRLVICSGRELASCFQYLLNFCNKGPRGFWGGWERLNVLDVFFTF